MIFPLRKISLSSALAYGLDLVVGETLLEVASELHWHESGWVLNVEAVWDKENLQIMQINEKPPLAWM